MEKLLDYLEKERISYSVECEGAVEINGQTFELIYPKDGLLFDDEFHLICDETFCDNYVFSFGGKYYWTPKGSEKSPKLNRLKYLGKAKMDYPTVSFLGIHGGFELLNGSRTYSDWVKKAKFLGVKNLGICEKNTLAGILKFQLECLKVEIKPIIGETVSVYVEKEDRFYDIKCFVKDEEGWLNLLSINKHINVDNVKFIRESDLFKYSKGLFFVIDPKSLDFDKAFPFDLSEEDFYYQLDTVEFENEERDEWYLKNLKKFYYSAFKPVSIVDAYYLDKEDYFIKKKLNLIRKENDPFTVNQYFKDKGDYFQELDLLSDPDSDELFLIFEEAVKNENKIAHFCNFNIDTKQRHLPRYEMNEEESSLYKDNDELLKALFLSGLKRKVSEKDYQRGLDRLNKEFEVIKIGDVVDYFLILHDIVRWSRSQKILSGIGRGSGGGSLIAYCLDLIHVNPLEFDLLFERFLTVERAKISLPDLDTDLPSERRDEVKRYMEQRFGLTQVCSVGTYSTLQLKALLKDFARLDNLNPGDMNYLTSILDLDKNTLEELFQNASSKTVLKRFVQENVELINDLELVLHQPKSPSIHACATLILPKERDIYHWIPVKKMSLKDGESMLVTEWEGGELEAAGFLKEDILGINQLDKFSNIVDLVKLHHGVDIDIYTIPYDDQEVIRFFKNGWNSDVFHFGSSGLTEYCKLMQPNNINDLVAAIALYRPGSMENNFHNEYVLRKNGEREVSYLWGTEKITKDTFGLIVYQEQVMQAAVTVGGFSLTEADDIRRAMGKKKKDLLDSYKKQFLEGAVKNSCEESIAIDIWDQLEKYAAYGFNKCISGEEKIYRNTNGSGFEPTIAEMFKIKNNLEYAKDNKKRSLHNKYKCLGYGTCYSLDSRGILIKNRVKDIRYEGVRDIFKIELETGQSIKVTDNHKFPTSNGVKEVKFINIEKDLLYINKGFCPEDTVYRFTDKGKGNKKYHNNDLVYEYSLNSEKGKEGFQKRNTPQTQLKYYVSNLKKDYCEVCDQKGKRLEIHHRDGNHGNNELSNLCTVCVSCHKKIHYSLGRIKQGEKGLSTELVGIKSITFSGKEDVYDVEVNSPNNTFVTKGGVVTCNSHAAAYSITGYISQWLKVHYPLEYWITALKYAEEKDYSEYLSEIYKTGSIKIVPVDINKSDTSTRADSKTNTIYWALTAIKQVGDTAANQIIEERSVNGDYFSFSEFCSRHSFKGSKINKRSIENLILSGAFDEIESIEDVRKRYSLIESYRKTIKTKIDEDRDIFATDVKLLEDEWWWSLQQKRLSGISFIDFERIIKNVSDNLRQFPYMDMVEFFEERDVNQKEYATLAGYVVECNIKDSKKGTFAELILENNYETFPVIIWSKVYESVANLLIDIEKKIVIVEGKVIKDKFRKKNVVQTEDNSTIFVLG